MLDYRKIKKIIKSSDNVFLTAHKNIDLDALGSIFGMYYITKSLKKDVYIVIDDEDLSTEIKRALVSFKKIENVTTYSYKEIKNELNSNSLLIVTDTSKVNRLQNKQLDNITNKIVIDHHKRTEDNMQNNNYEFINVASSSACEIILELLDKLKIIIPKEIASIMLAGIYVDTNGFLLKTTEKTHIYTSLLYKYGADNIEAQYLLKQNYNEFKRRQNLTLATEFYGNIAISVSNHKYSSVELAKASDVLLSFNNVEASFTIGKLDDNLIGISARSLGNIDVEDIMNYFNGGGHKTDAACQIKSDDIIKVKEKLIKYLGGLDESNIH